MTAKTGTMPLFPNIISKMKHLHVYVKKLREAGENQLEKEANEWYATGK